MLSRLPAWALLAPLAFSAASAEAQILTIEARMLTPLSSRHGEAPIEAVTIQPLIHEGRILIPSHSALHGTIRRASAVGIGLRHERASLEITFTDWKSPDGDTLPLEATPISVDNAREQMDDKGRIQGILAASNPLGIVRGLWYRPSAGMLLRAPAGLSGSGTLWSKLALGPIGALGLLGARLIGTRMPEPEIDLPIGTEMTLQLSSIEVGQRLDEVRPPAVLDANLMEFLQQQPLQVVEPDATPTADIINIALIGSAELVKATFRSAGWVEADDLDRKSFGSSYKAFTQRQGYATAPVSKLYYEDRLPDFVFQKSLNSIAKRHHIRLWRILTPDGQEGWLGAATHDITVVFDRKNFGLSHKVDPNIDLERLKVVSDLDFAAALAGIVYVPRTIPYTAGTETDGAIAVAFLQEPAAFVEPAAPERIRGSKLSTLRKFARRMILEARQHLLRENAYYLTYSVGRKLILKLRTVDPLVLAQEGAAPNVAGE